MPQQDMPEPDDIGQEPMGQGPQMGQEPPMDQNQQMDDMGGQDMGPDANMDPDNMGGMPDDGVDMGDMGDDSTMSIINQLSDTDKKAVRAYAESMLDRDETPNNNMMESFIFTKGQLDNIHEVLMANDNNEKKDPINKVNKKMKKGNTKSPFDSPFA